MNGPPPLAAAAPPGNLLRHLIRNERFKLAANLMNALAVAAVTVGFLGPVAADFYGLASAPRWTPLVAMPLWFLLAGVLHWAGWRL